MDGDKNNISVSKAKSISSLLMNFACSSSEMKDYHTLSTDGTDTFPYPPNSFLMNDSSEINKNKEYFREQFEVVEALARTSLLTSHAAQRRIAARKIEIDHGFNNESDFEPPKDLLIYLVR